MYYGGFFLIYGFEFILKYLLDKVIIWVLLVLQEDANSTTSGWGVETVKVEM